MRYISVYWNYKKMCGIDLVLANFSSNMSYSVSVIQETFIICSLIKQIWKVGFRFIILPPPPPKLAFPFKPTKLQGQKEFSEFHTRGTNIFYSMRWPTTPLKFSNVAGLIR